MPESTPQSASARLTPVAARSALAVSAVLTVVLVAVTLSPLAQSNADPSRRRQGDVQLYRAEVERIHDGAGYYAAAGAELRQRGYPTASVFNWRTPLPMWLIGSLPDVALGKAILGILSLAVLLLLSFEAMARDRQPVPVRGFPAAAIASAEKQSCRDHQRDAEPSNGTGLAPAILAAVLLTGPLMFCVLGELYVMPVLWAGVLIALSVGCYGVGRPGWGVAFGLAAVVFRELAMPYCLVAAGLAVWERRWREAVAWALGLGAYLALFGLHAWHVLGLIRPEDAAHAEGWLQLGGAAFVLSTAQINAYLLLLPQWLTALYFAAAMLGLAGWDTPLGRRVALTVCLFVLAFALVGQPFNQYWGALYTPLLCLGAARAPWAVRDLLQPFAGTVAFRRAVRLTR